MNFDLSAFVMLSIKLYLKSLLTEWNHSSQSSLMIHRVPLLVIDWLLITLLWSRRVSIGWKRGWLDGIHRCLRLKHVCLSHMTVLSGIIWTRYLARWGFQRLFNISFYNVFVRYPSKFWSMRNSHSASPQLVNFDKVISYLPIYSFYMLKTSRDWIKRLLKWVTREDYEWIEMH